MWVCVWLRCLSAVLRVLIAWLLPMPTAVGRGVGQKEKGAGRGRNMKMQCARNENIKNLIAIIQAHKMLMECM